MSPASPAYEAVSRAFYHGLAALQVGLLDDARTQFASATTIVPREPASWGNLGLTNLRLGDLDAAGPALERAASLAPASADIAFLQGQLEISRGRPAEAIAHFERGVRLDPRGLRIRYALAQEVESAGGAGADTRAQGLVDEILALSPDNVAAILERARLAAKRGDAAALQDAVGKACGTRGQLAARRARSISRAAGRRADRYGGSRANRCGPQERAVARALVPRGSARHPDAGRIDRRSVRSFHRSAGIHFETVAARYRFVVLD